MAPKNSVEQSCTFANKKMAGRGLKCFGQGRSRGNGRARGSMGHKREIVIEIEVEVEVRRGKGSIVEEGYKPKITPNPKRRGPE